MKTFVASVALKATFFAALLMLVAFTSCSNDKDDPAPGVVELPSEVIGVFTGNLSYTGSNGTIVSNEDGTATVTKTGDKTYSIAFSDGVASITNLKFKKSSDNAYASVGENGSISGMTLSASDLNVGVTANGSIWGFAGSK